MATDTKYIYLCDLANIIGYLRNTSKNTIFKVLKSPILYILLDEFLQKKAMSTGHSRYVI